MAPLALHDTLHLEATQDGISLECPGVDSSIPCDSSNLAWKAADAFLRAADIRGGVRMVLEKSIPAGAGLGGGSSDAAAVLRAMQRAFDSPLQPEVLRKIALSLGADVPFFLHEQAAVCRGVGEIFSATPEIQCRNLLLVLPPFGVSTAWAFRRYSQMLDTGTLPAPQTASPPWFSNDLEIPVFEKFPILRTLKEWLLDRGEIEAAAMSGSGSTIFGVLRENAPTDPITRSLQSAFGATFQVLRTTITVQTGV